MTFYVIVNLEHFVSELANCIITLFFRLPSKILVSIKKQCYVELSITLYSGDIYGISVGPG